MGHHNILLARGTTIMWAHCMSITFGQVPRTGPSRIGGATVQDYHMGLHDVLLAGGITLTWAHYMNVTFGQSASIGPPRTQLTAAQDYCTGQHNRVGPHNVLLVGDISPPMGPLDRCTIWTSSLHWPILGMVGCHAKLLHGPS
jgi:hypothetical protein